MVDKNYAVSLLGCANMIELVRWNSIRIPLDLRRLKILLLGSFIGVTIAATSYVELLKVASPPVIRSNSTEIVGGHVSHSCSVVDQNRGKSSFRDPSIRLHSLISTSIRSNQLHKQSSFWSFFSHWFPSSLTYYLLSVIDTRGIDYPPE